MAKRDVILFKACGDVPCAVWNLQHLSVQAKLPYQEITLETVEKPYIDFSGKFSCKPAFGRLFGLSDRVEAESMPYKSNAYFLDSFSGMPWNLRGKAAYDHR